MLVHIFSAISSRVAYCAWFANIKNTCKGFLLEMSSKGSRRVRGSGRKRYCGDAFVDELPQEVTSSIAA